MRCVLLIPMERSVKYWLLLTLSSVRQRSTSCLSTFPDCFFCILSPPLSSTNHRCHVISCQDSEIKWNMLNISIGSVSLKAIKCEGKEGRPLCFHPRFGSTLTLTGFTLSLNGHKPFLRTWELVYLSNIDAVFLSLSPTKCALSVLAAPFH